MRVVILAAGEGRRLLPLTKSIPKCMIEIQGKPILYYALEGLKKAGIEEEDIVIIAGHRKEAIEENISKKIQVVFNPEYHRKNNIYSLYMAKEFVSEDILILNSDVMFHPGMIEKIMKVSLESSVMVDMRKNLAKEDMKVVCKEKRLKRIAKTIPLSEAKGEYIGIARFRKKALFSLFSKIEEILANGGEEEWYERAFDEMTQDVFIECIPTDGLPWIEIDTFEDLKKAVEIAKKIRKVLWE